MPAQVSIERVGAERVDEAGPLFRSMVEHHRAVVEGKWPVRDATAAWQRRRREYVEWLSGSDAWMLLAKRDGERQALGYAVLRLVPSGATWELGDRVGSLESLAVAVHVRNQGIGTSLISACRDICIEHGATHWIVEVVEANRDAVRMYERHGFRPYYRMLLGEL